MTARVITTTEEQASEKEKRQPDACFNKSVIQWLLTPLLLSDRQVDQNLKVRKGGSGNKEHVQVDRKCLKQLRPKAPKALFNSAAAKARL